MKKITYLAALFILVNTYTNGVAQNFSKIKTKQIMWIADGKKISIEAAQKGIKKPERLSIMVILENDVVQRHDGQKLEFKWYKIGSTRPYLTNSFIKKISKQKATESTYKIITSRPNLKKGWWKVKIEAYVDRKMLSYQNKQDFWIKLL